MIPDLFFSRGCPGGQRKALGFFVFVLNLPIRDPDAGDPRCRAWWDMGEIGRDVSFPLSFWLSQRVDARVAPRIPIPEPTVQAAQGPPMLLIKRACLIPPIPSHRYRFPALAVTDYLPNWNQQLKYEKAPSDPGWRAGGGRGSTDLCLRGIRIAISSARS